MSAILSFVNILLQMFNTDAHSKRLCLHGNAHRFQMAEGIPGAVSDGKNHMITGKSFLFVDLQAGNSAVFLVQVRNLGIEPDFTAQREDPLTDILHHGKKHIGTHMGFGIKENILTGAGFHKLLQHPADTGIVHAGIQFTVRESTGTAFAELDIAFCIQFAGLEEFLYFFVTGSCIFTPFQNNGAKAVDGQNQRRKHTGRAKPYHHRAMFGKALGLGHLVIRHRSKTCTLAAGIFEDFLFISIHGHIDCVDNTDVRLFSGIHRPANDLQFTHLGGGNPQQLGCLERQLGHIMLRVHRNLAYSNHFVSFPA